MTPEEEQRARELAGLPPRDQPIFHGNVGTAARYLATSCMYGEQPVLRRWRGAWYRWSPETGCYREASDEAIEADLYRKLGLGKRSEVGDVRHALIALDEVLIDHADVGSWLGPAPDGMTDSLDVAACRNGIVHLPTGRIVPVTPRLFTTSTLGAEFKMLVRPPTRWLAFLHELWPDDEDSIRTLQEWFGYLLTGDTRQQKMMMLVGPKRSGKGTIGRVLYALQGGGAVSPTVASLATQFGMQPLIGKRAAIIGDMRISSRTDTAVIAERLLSLSGEDPITIDRKFKDLWTGFPGVRVTILTNEIPKFADASGALASRFMILRTRRSWYGQEDPGLTGRMLAELPEVFGWAIEGWRRLRERGYFKPPTSSDDEVRDMEDLGAPVKAWIRQRCNEGPKCDVPCTAAYTDFEKWCTHSKLKQIPTVTTFGRDIRTAGCERKQLTKDGKLTWCYVGVSLKTTD